MTERSGFCGGCTECCRSTVPIEATDDPRLTEFVIVGDSKRTKRGADGSCIYRSKTGCIVYEYRPQICRDFDCRADFLRTALARIQIDEEEGTSHLGAPVEKAAIERLITAIGAEDYV